ncbi:MAG: hypothetical protein LUQ59_12255 [Methanothrix sp.]|nr:hypothetical protein [Methanothrix sp.]
MALKIATTICGLYALLILSGCSIAMALSGQKEPNFDYITVGAPRNQVEAEFGHPAAANALADGKQESTYKYEMSNSPNSGRAWVNFYIDLATFGLAEPILTVIELIQPHDEETRIVYGQDNKVFEIHGYTPPPISKVVIEAEESQEKYIERRRSTPRTDQPVRASTSPSQQETGTPCVSC